jgi:hypothetical protein
MHVRRLASFASRLGVAAAALASAGCVDVEQACSGPGQRCSPVPSGIAIPAAELHPDAGAGSGGGAAGTYDLLFGNVGVTCGAPEASFDPCAASPEFLVSVAVPAARLHPGTVAIDGSAVSAAYTVSGTVEGSSQLGPADCMPLTGSLVGSLRIGGFEGNRTTFTLASAVLDPANDTWVDGEWDAVVCP